MLFWEVKLRVLSCQAAAATSKVSAESVAAERTASSGLSRPYYDPILRAQPRVYVDFCHRLFSCGLIEFVRSATELESLSMEARLWKWMVWTFQMPFTTLNFPKSLGPCLLWIPSGHGTLESSLVKVKK